MFLFSCFQIAFQMALANWNNCWKFTWHLKSFSIFSTQIKVFCLSEYLIFGSGNSTHEKCIFKISSDLFIHLHSYHLDSVKANIPKVSFFFPLCKLAWQWTWITFLDLLCTKSLLYWSKKICLYKINT